MSAHKSSSATYLQADLQDEDGSGDSGDAADFVRFEGQRRSRESEKRLEPGQRGQQKDGGANKKPKKLAKAETVSVAQ